MTEPSLLSWIRQATPYIRKHRQRTLVICLSGDCAQSAGFPQLVHDLAILNTLGMRLVICHGGRPQIETAIKENGLNNRYANGIRVTDAATLKIVKQVLGEIHAHITAMLSMAGPDIKIISGNFVSAKPIGIREGVDHLYSGQVRSIDARLLHWQLEQGAIVLLSPLAHSPSGETFTLKAEQLAAHLARALQADKAVFLVHEPELFKFAEQFRALTLVETKSQLTQAWPESVQHYLRLALDISSQGVNRVHYLDQALDGAVILELLTRDGCGLMITADNYDDMRQADLNDIAGILELIEPLEAEGILVRRSRQKLETEIEHFFIMLRDGMIIGCAALYPYIDQGVAELACLAVHPQYQSEGRGNALLEALTKKAVSLNIRQMFVLTTQTSHWFLERDFKQVDIQSLPVKHQALYNYKRNSKVFIKQI